MSKNKKELTDRQILESHPHFIVPNDENLERGVLGALLIEPNRVLEIANIIATKDVFYNYKYASIYECMLNIFNRGELPDLLVVANEVKSLNISALELAELTDVIGSGLQLVNHSRLLVQLYIGRRMIIHSINISSKAQDTTYDIADIIGEANRDIEQISSSFNFGEPQHISTFLKESVKNAETRYNNYTNGIAIGIPTGLSELDNLIGGWKGGELTVIAARPSMGKTQLTLFLTKIAGLNNKNVLFYSLEMKEVSLTDRMLIGDGNIDRDRFKKGSMTKEDWEGLDKSVKYLEELPISIKNKAGLTMIELKAQATLAKKKGKLDLIIIDYLQLMGVSKGSSREQQVAQISMGLKQLSLQLDVPIILLAQLSRAVEGRQDKTPLLSDLRESGSIEQDADNVIFIDRPIRWGLSEVEINGENVSSEGIARLIVAKQRDGACDIVHVRHNNTLTQFYDYNDYNDINFDNFKIEEISLGEDLSPF